MKNIIIGIVVLATIVFGVLIILDYNNEVPVTDIEESTTVRDEFGEKYDIDNEYFVFSDSDEVFAKIDNDETFIVFVGRET